MRWILLFPLTFIAGVHGFALFAPYLFVIAMVAAARASRALVRLPRAASAPNAEETPDAIHPSACVAVLS